MFKSDLKTGKEKIKWLHWDADYNWNVRPKSDFPETQDQMILHVWLMLKKI